MKHSACVIFVLLFSSVVNSVEPNINSGSGDFSLSCSDERKHKLINVYYHKPAVFNHKSPVLIAVPGGGRNGQDYRNSLIKLSEKMGVLILSPSYSKAQYPGFWSYNLGGMISDVVINGDGITLDSYLISTEPNAWIFSDFDCIYNAVSTELNLAGGYDLFGHSAGAQFVHRSVLFHHSTKVKRIIAANAGSYTAFNFAEKFPYGLKESAFDYQQTQTTFETELIILLGSLDNQSDTKGLMRSEQHDVQGTNRFDRGHYFFTQARTLADDLGLNFKWRLSVVDGVGHEYQKMGQAAMMILYGNDTTEKL